MGTATKPVFARLTARECNALLRRNHVGRIAFLNDGLVDIEPVHFVASSSWLLMRSAEGTKLEAFAHSPYVAFEVDEVDGPFDWRSVVVHGTIYVMADQGGRFDREFYRHSLAALRAFVPGVLTADDPTPFRDTIYGLHMDRVTGRMGTSHRRQTPRKRSLVIRPRKAAAKRRRTTDGF
jgi:hypothetical protein